MSAIGGRGGYTPKKTHSRDGTTKSRQNHTVEEVDPFKLDRGAAVAAARPDFKHLAKRESDPVRAVRGPGREDTVLLVAARGMDLRCPQTQHNPH